MKFKVEKTAKITIFGKQFSGWQHLFLVFGYLIFLIIPWPIISGSYLFVPFAVVLLPLFPAVFIYDEFTENVRVYKILLYSGLAITTFIYTYFFLDISMLTGLLHLIVYGFFGYIFAKKFEVDED